MARDELTAETTGLVVEVVTVGPCAAVDGIPTSPVLTVVVVVTMVTGWLLGPSTGLGPSSISSSSDGSNFRFLGSLQTSCTGCLSSLLEVEQGADPLAVVVVVRPRPVLTPTRGRLTVAAGILELAVVVLVFRTGVVSPAGAGAAAPSLVLVALDTPSLRVLADPRCSSFFLPWYRSLFGTES